MQPRPTPLSGQNLTPFLDLNNGHPVEVGPALAMPAFMHMVAMAFYARGYAHPPGFLLVFDENAAYANVNFRWFKARYPRFAYVDRILIGQAARGRGYARALYDDLFAVAAASGHTIVCAEINSDPPNPVSDKLHEALGFTTVGSAVLPGSGRSVRYVAARLG